MQLIRLPQLEGFNIFIRIQPPANRFKLTSSPTRKSPVSFSVLQVLRVDEAENVEYRISNGNLEGYQLSETSMQSTFATYKSTAETRIPRQRAYSYMKTK